MCVIPSPNDNWIVTAAIKSLNKDTFQDDSVCCLIIQRCFVIACARHAPDFSLCLAHSYFAPATNTLRIKHKQL